MDFPNILSRRSLLKGSSFLAATVVVAPAAAVTSPSVPQVLIALLSEYEAAGEAVKRSHNRMAEARRAKAKALDDADLSFIWPDGTVGRIGDSGNRYHPEYALAWLEREHVKALSEAWGNADMLAQVRKQYLVTRTQIRELALRYDAIVATTDWPAADVADGTAYHRFVAARDALCAYRPETMQEVAALIRCISKVGPYPGTNNGITVRNLADMLDGEQVA